MAWHVFGWQQLFCIFKLCLFGTGSNGWCRYGCYCGLGSKVKRTQILFFILMSMAIKYQQPSFQKYFNNTSKGKDPQDGMDEVCSVHDRCWDELKIEKNCSYGLWQHYKWDIIADKVHILKNFILMFSTLYQQNIKKLLYFPIFKYFGYCLFSDCVFRRGAKLWLSRRLLQL